MLSLIEKQNQINKEKKYIYLLDNCKIHVAKEVLNKLEL